MRTVLRTTVLPHLQNPYFAAPDPDPCTETPPYKFHSAKYVFLFELADVAILCQISKLTVKESERIFLTLKIP